MPLLILTKSAILQLEFLDFHYPNLSLIERLWTFFKKKVLYNQYHENIKTFRSACINFFRNIDQYSDEITSLMNDEFEIDYT